MGFYTPGTSDPFIGLLHGAISHSKLTAIIGGAALLGWALLPASASGTCADGTTKYEVNGHAVCSVEGGHATKAQADLVLSFAGP